MLEVWHGPSMYGNWLVWHSIRLHLHRWFRKPFTEVGECSMKIKTPSSPFLFTVSIEPLFDFVGLLYNSFK